VGGSLENKLIYSIPVKYGLPADEATDVFRETCLALLSELPDCAIRGRSRNGSSR
jgi:hypothetical protein